MLTDRIAYLSRGVRLLRCGISNQLRPKRGSAPGRCRGVGPPKSNGRFSRDWSNKLAELAELEGDDQARLDLEAARAELAAM